MQTLNRNEFARLIGSTYSNVDNLTRAGQLALAFGLTTPAMMGIYHPLDVFANALAVALVERGYARETAVRIVREHHETWLHALTRAEWELHMVSFNARGEKIEPTREIYFALARVGRGKKGEIFRAAAGLPDQALEKLRKGGAPLDMVFVNVHDVLHEVREAFYENDLLEKFVVGPGANMPLFTRHSGHAEFQTWREEIVRYCQQSVDRVKTRECVRRAVTKKLKRPSKLSTA
jgi:hypothetical protein